LGLREADTRNYQFRWQGFTPIAQDSLRGFDIKH
jgi:hypothetical protein